MKNFDQQRAARAQTADDRTFLIGGEQFICRAGIRPEVLTPYEDLDGSQSASETLVIIDEMVVSCIESYDDAEGRYRRLRAREDDPVTLDDLTEIAKWLLETVTGKSPTKSPADSSQRRGETGTPSTENSSSPELQAA